MSTSAYYNFITSTKPTNQATDTMLVEPHSSIEIQRQTAVSPSSFTASSSSNSSSSLYQFNSLTPTSSSSSSSSSSSASSTASSTNSNLFPRNHRDFLRQTSVTPTQTHQHLKHHASQLFHSYTLHSLEPKPLKPFKNRSDYLEAMKEDLAEWLNRLYSDLDLTPDNFFAQLETGSTICRHANNVTQMGRNFLVEQNSRDASFNNSQNESSKLSANNVHNNDNNRSSRDSVDTDSLPSSNESSSFSSTNFLNSYNNQRQQSKYCSLSFGQNSLGPTQKLADRKINWFRIKTLPYKQDACPGTFFARDNICQFILWCRSLNILECLLFETDDLVARKNEKSFILCLLEVARIGFKVGMPTPLIIQLEQEIDREIENDAKRELEEKQNQGKTTTDIYGENNRESEATNQINKQERGDNELVLDEMRVEVEQNESKDDEVEEVEEEEEEDTGPKPQVITNDLVSLHEKVSIIISMVSCHCHDRTSFLPLTFLNFNVDYAANAMQQQFSQLGFSTLLEIC